MGTGKILSVQNYVVDHYTVQIFYPFLAWSWVPNLRFFLIPHGFSYAHQFGFLIISTHFTFNDSQNVRKNKLTKTAKFSWHTDSSTWYNTVPWVAPSTPWIPVSCYSSDIGLRVSTSPTDLLQEITTMIWYQNYLWSNVWGLISSPIPDLNFGLWIWSRAP